MTRTLIVIMVLAGAIAPACACDGPAGNAIALTTNGNNYTVTNIGRAPVTVTFSAWGKTYSLALAPGQSGTPSSGGLFNLPMKGYQSCVAIPAPTH
jgi:hypothetical protein